MSYPRGEETTPFAKQLKAFLESRGFEVWMDEEGIKRARIFGGCNVLYVGDFWQLDPVGNVALMKNPFRGKAVTCESEHEL